MLTLQAATLGYRGTAVLHDVDVTVRRGERVVMLGPSGAGKTTLLTALYRAAGAAAALIPQPHGLVGPLSAAHNIALGLIDQRLLWRNLQSLCWMPRAERARISDVAASLDLVEALDHAVDRLSGGQQSRVAIGRALYRGGDLLLADEPCAALDPERARQAIVHLGARFGTLICAMHDVDAGLQLATRVLGVADGRIAFDLPPQALTPVLLESLYGRATPGAVSAPQQTRLTVPRGCM